MEERINPVFLMTLVSFGLAIFCVLCTYVSAWKITDIGRHQRIWVAQSRKSGVPGIQAILALGFWLGIGVASMAVVFLALHTGGGLLGFGSSPGFFILGYVAVVGAAIAGIRDAGAKWREMHWLSSDTVVPLAQHLGTKIEFTAAKAASGAQ